MGSGCWKKYGTTWLGAGSKAEVNIVEWEDKPTIVFITMPNGGIVEMPYEDFLSLRAVIKSVIVK